MGFRLLFLITLFFGSLQALTWTDFSSAIAATGTNPQVATDGSGKALAVWLEGTTAIKGSYFNGTSWGTAATLQSGADTLTEPVLAMDTSENAIASWRSSASGGVIEVAIYDPAMDSWSSPVTVSGGPDLTAPPVYTPRVAIANNGKAQIIFACEIMAPGPSFFVLCFGRDYTFATDTWNPALASDPDFLSSSPDDVDLGSITLTAFNNGGAIDMAAYMTLASATRISTATAENSSGGGVSLTGGTGGAGTRGIPAIAGISQTEIVAIFPIDFGATTEMQSRSISNFGSASWSGDSIDGSEDVTLSGSTIAMDSGGIAYAAWVANDGVNSRIQYSKLDPGVGFWDTAVDISDESDASNPTISLDSSGMIVLVWEQDGAVLGRTNTAGVWDPLLSASPTTISPAGANVSLAVLSTETSPRFEGINATADDAFAVWEESGGIYGALGSDISCPSLLDFLLDDVGGSANLPENPTVQDILDVYRGKR